MTLVRLLKWLGLEELAPKPVATTIQKVEIVVTTNRDPNDVARRVADELAKLAAQTREVGRGDEPLGTSPEFAENVRQAQQEEAEREAVWGLIDRARRDDESVVAAARRVVVDSEARTTTEANFAYLWHAITNSAPSPALASETVPAQCMALRRTLRSAESNHAVLVEIARLLDLREGHEFKDLVEPIRALAQYPTAGALAWRVASRTVALNRCVDAALQFGVRCVFGAATGKAETFPDPARCAEFVEREFARAASAVADATSAKSFREQVLAALDVEDEGDAIDRLRLLGQVRIKSDPPPAAEDFD